MKDVTLKIKSALFRADDSTMETYKIIGSELKAKRLSLAKTLQAVSGDICSVSYLCKIENNRIIPNRIYLREICKRLDMQSSKIEALMDLKESLIKCVKAFLNNDFKTIESKYIGGRSLINYRYKLIEFIYFIAKKDYNTANKKSDALMKLCNNMTEADLVIFSVFNGILSFYNQEFDDALECLDYAIEFSNNSNINIIILALRYKLFSYIELDNSCSIFVYNRLINLLFENGYLDKLDEIHYVMCIYLLKNKNLTEYKRIFKLVKNKSYRKSLYLFAKLILNPYLRIKRSWLENVEPFFYLLGLIKVDLAEAKKQISILKPSSFNEFFNPIYLQYLVLETDDDRLSFINNIAIPTIDKTKGSSLAKFVIIELSKICKRANKYKMFIEAFRTINGIR